MLCILAFVLVLIFFPILGFFPEYRALFKKSWRCVFLKVTMQPCDINLGEEIKNKMLGKLVFRTPRLAKFLDKTFTFWAFLFVAVNIWSLIAAGLAGLNLWVYDTCDPISGESCSLSGEACGVASNSLTFTDAWENNKLGEYAVQPFKQFGDTIAKIPNRLKTWEAKDYLAPKPTYNRPFESGKSTAVEIIDPGCTFCRQLYRNSKASGFADKYNLSFVLYPIPDSKNTFTGGYKFQSSAILASYIEASKYLTPEKKTSDLSPDWQLLDIIFTGKENGQDNQELFNFTYSKAEIITAVHKILTQIGYSTEQIGMLDELSKSSQILDNLAVQKDIAEKKVNTIRIPTLIFNGRRYDRVLSQEQLKK